MQVQPDLRFASICAVWPCSYPGPMKICPNLSRVFYDTLICLVWYHLRHLRHAGTKKQSRYGSLIHLVAQACQACLAFLRPTCSRHLLMIRRKPGNGEVYAANILLVDKNRVCCPCKYISRRVWQGCQSYLQIWVQAQRVIC